MLDQVISARDLKKELENAPKQQFFKSTFEGLDTLLGGFAEGDFVVVGGEQKSGKTTLCVTLTKRFSEQGVRCLWFSIELPYQEFLELFGKELPDFYVPRKREQRTVKWIEEKIKDATENHGVKIVFIDHLGLIADEQTVGRYNSIDIIDARLDQIRQLALKYRVCIIGVSEYNKESMKKVNTEMRTDNLRGTARLGYVATAVIGIERLAGVKRARVWQDIKNEPEEIFISSDMWIYILESRRTGARKIKIACEMNEEGDIIEKEV